jgi:MATE family multidrug resistance protein
MEFLPWLMILPITGFSSFIWDGVYIGATASRLMRNTMLLATLVFFSLFYLLKGNLGNHALWLAMNCFMLGRGVFQTFFYKQLKIFR